ncbi:alpha-2C adrenergic receptor-like [Ostrea edulis]|uniref:alpha-2C adrenergic receptor-like n=1 Tax=Ostrea edulis TaxID=37623 RepID=UPI002095F0FC|nr:alpha-2C adrenergic receptor-like [Ostrea edulis]XP_056004145.1 alpha-2C adrenergic receptor-like [Ostrea edulis]XP_056004151.1 alpha-2C adrenergic receptor-like [Ostrea edulis]XP_056004156.1 alpha-2C adrenergic receptor-like [Ostrea edulis]
MNTTECPGHSEEIHCEEDDGRPGCPMARSDIIVITMLAVFSVIGIIGNGIVIFVYTKKKDKLTSSVFILGLAVYDFLTCSIIIPYTACMIYLRFMISYDALCKIYMFLITFSVPLSAFLMVAIAVDRYLCICHPFLHLLTKNRARAVIGLLTVFACVLGVLSCISYSVYKKRDSSSSEYVNCTISTHDVKNDVQENLTSSEKYVNTGQCDYPGTIVSMEYLITWQKIYSSFYLISLIIVLLLYIMIYHSVTRRRSKRRKQKALNNISLKASLKEPPKQNNHSPSSSYTVLAVDENNETTKEPVNLQVEMRENGVSSRPVERAANETSPLQQQPSRGEHTHHHHHQRDHDTIANIKTALMLFIVAVVFIIAFFPAWLMALNAIDHNNIIFYMYFAYNVTNPIIYAFMNPTFRSDVKKICH